jgi:hypothetical protein
MRISMRSVIAVPALTLLILAPGSIALAQLVADGPVTNGHHHLLVSDVEASKKFWVDALGGVGDTFGGRTTIAKFPNALVFLGAGKPTAGSKGSTVDLLHGLQGAIDGVDYGAPMVPMNSYSDAELANVLTYVRNSFGNRAPAVEPKTVAARRAADAAHANYWTIAELTRQIPALAVPRKRFERRAEWKLAANMEARTTAPVEAMLDGDPKTGYFTQGFKPFPVETLTVELPARSKIVGIDIDSRGERGQDGKDMGWSPTPSDRISGSPRIRTTSCYRASPPWAMPCTTTPCSPIRALATTCCGRTRRRA